MHQHSVVLPLFDVLTVALTLCIYLLCHICHDPSCIGMYHTFSSIKLRTAAAQMMTVSWRVRHRLGLCTSMGLCSVHHRLALFLDDQCLFLWWSVFLSSCKQHQVIMYVWRFMCAVVSSLSQGDWSHGDYICNLSWRGIYIPPVCIVNAEIDR